MANLSLWSSLTAPSLLSLDSQSCLHPHHVTTPPNSREFRISAAKSGISSFIPVGKKCQTCGGQGAIECQGCKGTGKNKKNGNIFERWKCFDCQGFGLKSCPTCGKGGSHQSREGRDEERLGGLCLHECLWLDLELVSSSVILANQ